MERDPTKRKVRPAQALFDFEDLGESSDDSDFRIEDHCDDSDDDTIDSARENESSEEEGSNEEELDEMSKEKDEEEDCKVLSDVQNIKGQFDSKNALQIMICSVCLGDRSDAHNEIIECDKCGVTVHEGCYGVMEDSDSLCSTDSPNPTTPWFCDACKAGVVHPECELCPNGGGIFKETDVGKWTHLVCALYMPGVAFAEVDRLSSITLFEMSYTKWGAKACSLCRDQRFASTGVTISCDAGMCKTFFHVTCGQQAGLLSEAHSEEVDQADPFYAHCKLHSDKALIKKRRRNWLALQMRFQEIEKHKKPNEELNRIERRLTKYRKKYHSFNLSKPQPWVPTQKMARLLHTSASACRKLWQKGELSGTDTRSLELRQAQIELLSDVHRRWHIQPAFSVEFIAYFLDRNGRVASLRKQLADLIEEHDKLLCSQAEIQEKRDTVVKKNSEELEKNKDLKKKIEVYHEVVGSLVKGAKLPDLDLLGRPILYPPNHPMGGSGGMVPTPAALKAGLGYKISEPSESGTEKTDEGSVNLNNSCGICDGSNDQHLLAKCDTCKKFYHLGCLTPPLLRMPKKTKQMGWQCSECDNSDSDGSVCENVDTEAPRKLRRRDSMEEAPFTPPGTKPNEKVEADGTEVPPENVVTENGQTKPGGEGEEEMGIRGGKKRRREKHHRYSPDPGSIKPHKHKHKRRKSNALPIDNQQRQSLKICFKSIPHPTGGGSSYVATPSGDLSTGQARLEVASPTNQPPSATKKKDDKPVLCIGCKQPGTPLNLVRCDECLNGFHFQCLDPPVKKSPKVKGYSWHCANCDPTSADSDDMAS